MILALFLPKQKTKNERRRGTQMLAVPAALLPHSTPTEPKIVLPLVQQCVTLFVKTLHLTELSLL